MFTLKKLFVSVALLAASFTAVFAQTGTKVSGRITDQNGEPLAGVAV